MALYKNADLTLSNAYKRIGEIGLKICQTRRNGFDESVSQKHQKIQLIKSVKLLRSILTYSVYNDDGEFTGTVRVDDDSYNKLLRALIKIADVKNLPVSPILLFRGKPYIRVAGGQGEQGDPGQDVFLYIGYAEDSLGTGYSSSPGGSRDYIAFRKSITSLVESASIFTGLWKKYVGENGADGADGADGQSQYVFIAWADDNAGTGFTLTFSPTKQYIGFLVKNNPTPPTAPDYAGLWAKYLGSNGTNGTNGFSVLSGSGAPAPGLGVNGDFYIDISAPYDIYGPKTGGSWGTGTSLIGPIGPAGLAGVDGADGADGINSYLYIAYADDASGNGFTLTFDQNKNYIALLQSSVVLSPVVTDFAGLWTKYQGDGDRWSTTSVTTLTIGTGVKNLVIGLNLAYSTGQRIVIALDGDEDTRMEGYVRSYDPTTGQLIADIDAIFGSGTHNVWDINLFGVPVQVITTDSYFGEIYVEDGAGTQSLSTSYTKINQFTDIGSVSPGVNASHSNDNIQVTVRGSYKCVADLSISGDTAGMEVIIALFKNGTVIPGTQSRVVLPQTTDKYHVQIESIQELSGNDIIDVRAKAGSGTPDLTIEDGRLLVSTTGSPSTPGGGTSIQFQDEGVDLGDNQADTVDFIGPGVTATRTLNKVTVEIPGGISEIDGGSATSIYLTEQNFDGGNA